MTSVSWRASLEAMNDVQKRIAVLAERGWTDAAIGDELGYGRVTVFRWRAGEQYPDHSKSVVMALAALLARKRIPKKRRYAKGSRLKES